MGKTRSVHYYPCSTLCHGECEVILVKQMQVKTHKNLNYLAEKNGTKSIIINNINKYLLTYFPSKKDYTDKYSDFLKYDKKRIYDHKIFTIMDKDDTPDKLFEEYKNKKLFEQYWWGKEGYLEPIYFYPDMDTVFTNHGFKIDKSGHKPKQYTRLLTTKYYEVIEMLRNLPERESNIKKYIEYVEKAKY